jgi:hypothetical protein
MRLGTVGDSLGLAYKHCNQKFFGVKSFSNEEWSSEGNLQKMLILPWQDRKKQAATLAKR